MSIPSFSLEGKVAIVTGGGSGIGRGIALRFAEAGADVVVAGRRLSVLEKMAEELKALGRRSLSVQTDVSQKGDVDNLIQTVVAGFGRVDILVNNAGIAHSVPFVEMTDDLRDRIWDINVKGVWDCTRAVIPSMIKQKYGKIINVVSRAGIQGSIGQINYSAAKGGMIQAVKSAAKELARYGITANAIAPTAATPMTEKLRTDPKFKDVYLKQIPMGRWAEPEEIVPAFVFFASDDSNYCTGQVLNVDGGTTM